MKTNLLLMSSLMMLGCGRVVGTAIEKSAKREGVVYVSDSRKEIAEITNPLIQKLARANVALIENENLREDGNYVALSGPDLRSRFNLCADQRYLQQQSIANCTGTLISPRHILTAGHCLSEVSCSQFKIVFDFKHDTDTYSPQGYRLPRESVYSCKRIVSRVADPGWGKADYTIVELDRPVKNREPVVLASAPLKAGDPVFALGYPLGIAMKYAHGTIREDMNSATYLTAIDTFAGNSGSPVFDEKTHTLVGLLSGGEADLIQNPGAGCSVVKVCETGKCIGERVFKTSTIADLIRKQN